MQHRATLYSIQLIFIYLITESGGGDSDGDNVGDSDTVQKKIGLF